MVQKGRLWQVRTRITVHSRGLVPIHQPYLRGHISAPAAVLFIPQTVKDVNFYGPDSEYVMSGRCVSL